MQRGCSVAWRRYKPARSSGPLQVARHYPKSPDVIREPNDGYAMRLAVIDGPYDATALSSILAQVPVSLGNGTCGLDPGSACNHGTFVMGLLGARGDALIPGLCPDCRLFACSAIHRRKFTLGECRRARECDHGCGRSRSEAHQSQSRDVGRRSRTR